MQKMLILLLKKLELLSALACRLTQITGKASVPTHPKHLIEFNQHYYIHYLKTGDLVLDLGSSKGEQTFIIANRVRKVVGLEKDTNHLKIAETEAKNKGISNITFIQHNLEKRLPVESNSFDKVNFLAVLEHLHNRDQALAEIHRVLKTHGMLFLSIPNKNTSWKKLERQAGLLSFSDPDHKHEFSLNEIKSFLKKHKFKILKTEYAGFDTPLAGLIDFVGGISLSLYKFLVTWRVKKAYENPSEAAGFKFVCIKQ